MATFVALLRAVNVGTTNRIRMADLTRAFVEAGYPDAVTHIQTGNVLFLSDDTAAAAKTRVEALIHDTMGVAIDAIIRTAGELDAVTRANPFATAEVDTARLGVGFLDAQPPAQAVAAFCAAPIGDDEVCVEGREVYIRYAVGAGSTKLTAGVWKRLGVPFTARNWNVTTTLARLAAEHR